MWRRRLLLLWRPVTKPPPLPLRQLAVAWRRRCTHCTKPLRLPLPGWAGARRRRRPLAKPPPLALPGRLLLHMPALPIGQRRGLCVACTARSQWRLRRLVTLVGLHTNKLPAATALIPKTGRPAAAAAAARLWEARAMGKARCASRLCGRSGCLLCIGLPPPGWHLLLLLLLLLLLQGRRRRPAAHLLAARLPRAAAQAGWRMLCPGGMALRAEAQERQIGGHVCVQAGGLGCQGLGAARRVVAGRPPHAPIHSARTADVARQRRPAALWAARGRPPPRVAPAGRQLLLLLLRAVPFLAAPPYRCRRQLHPPLQLSRAPLAARACIGQLAGRGAALPRRPTPLMRAASSLLPPLRVPLARDTWLLAGSMLAAGVGAVLALTPLTCHPVPACPALPPLAGAGAGTAAACAQEAAHECLAAPCLLLGGPRPPAATRPTSKGHRQAAGIPSAEGDRRARFRSLPGRSWPPSPPPLRRRGDLWAGVRMAWQAGGPAACHAASKAARTLPSAAGMTPQPAAMLASAWQP